MDVKLPLPPTEVSPDGREIWAWAGALSRATQLAHDIRQTQGDLRRLASRCGDCDKWMKSRECPMERNVNGMSRGPSCDAPKCGQFVENWSVSKRRIELQAKLDRLTTTTLERREG